ncbi:MAG: hypothetical protein ACUVWP_08265 [bacterium]
MKKIDYKEIIQKYPWIAEKDQYTILSPDADGFLCGLFMSNYLNWKIVGFYDGKILKIKKNTSTKNCIFLDMEILRKNIRSIGHHMNIHNINDPPPNYHEIMKNCINPNYIRKFDRAHNFSQKYPLGIIHFLIFIIDNITINASKIKKEGVGAILFADGIWKILFKYTDNFLDWFNFLDVGERSDWWRKLKQLSVIDLIEEINLLIYKLKEIHPEKKKWYGHIDISDFENQKKLLISFLNVIGELTGWNYKSKNWYLDDLKTYTLKKYIYDGERNNVEFLKIWRKNPLSLAMTEGSTIQYTLEKPDKLP